MIKLEIRVVKVGKRYLAVTQLGGQLVKGPLTDGKREALQGLFARLGDFHSGDDDIQLAVELAAEGLSLETLTALPAAEDDAASD